jgi:hypothetical protein
LSYTCLQQYYIMVISNTIYKEWRCYRWL